LRSALLRLDEAIARHEAQLAGVRQEGHPSLQILRRSVALMRQEADRLRETLEA